MTETPAIYHSGDTKPWRCEHCNHVLGDVAVVDGRQVMTLVDKLRATATGKVVAFRCPVCNGANIWCREC